MEEVSSNHSCLVPVCHTCYFHGLSSSATGMVTARFVELVQVIIIIVVNTYIAHCMCQELLPESYILTH